jgi:hypothetical protein
MAPLHFGMETLDRQSGAAPAAVIVEPIVSAGGVIELPVAYLQGLRKELDRRGALATRLSAIFAAAGSCRASSSCATGAPRSPRRSSRPTFIATA